MFFRQPELSVAAFSETFLAETASFVFRGCLSVCRKISISTEPFHKISVSRYAANLISAEDAGLSVFAVRKLILRDSFRLATVNLLSVWMKAAEASNYHI